MEKFEIDYNECNPMTLWSNDSTSITGGNMDWIMFKLNMAHNAIQYRIYGYFDCMNMLTTWMNAFPWFAVQTIWFEL